jgi:hypothetical protein
MNNFYDLLLLMDFYFYFSHNYWINKEKREKKKEGLLSI